MPLGSIATELAACQIWNSYDDFNTQCHGLESFKSKPIKSSNINSLQCLYTMWWWVDKHIWMHVYIFAVLILILWHSGTHMTHRETGIQCQKTQIQWRGQGGTNWQPVWNNQASISTHRCVPIFNSALGPAIYIFVVLILLCCLGTYFGERVPVAIITVSDGWCITVKPSSEAHRAQGPDSI